MPLPFQFVAVVEVLRSEGPLAGMVLEQRTRYAHRSGAEAHMAAMPAGATRGPAGPLLGFTVVSSRWEAL